MRRKNWYLLSLALPIVVSGAAWGIFMLIKPLPFNVSGLLSALFILTTSLTLTVVILPVPYVMFAALMLWWGWNKTAHQLARASWWAPVLFIPLFVIITSLLCLPLQFYLLGTQDYDLHYLLHLGSLIGFSLLWVIPLGYFYVLLAHGLAWVLDKANLIID